MQLKLIQVANAHEAIKDLAEKKLPFRLSLLISRNLAALEKEYEFYLEQERKFVLEYLVIDPNTGLIEQSQAGFFRIQEGKSEECAKARKALDDFMIDIEIQKIPISMLESFEFTPAQLLAIDFMIEEEEEYEQSEYGTT